MDYPTIFIYAKKGKIKALSLESATSQGKGLESQGWVHTQTLDACTWIECIHNECNEFDVMDEPKALTKPPAHIPK